VRITFLGSGAAFSPSAYNASILVDRTVLLDAGAPLCVHLPRVGVGLDEPKAVLLSHFHADHSFNLAWLIAGRTILHDSPPPLAVYGPAGTEDFVRRLMDFAWGERLRRESWERLQLQVHELDDGQQVEVAGFAVRAYRMVHVSTFTSLGFVLANRETRLGYTGDCEPGPALEALVADSDHVIAEMTYDDRPGESHLSRVDIEALMRRHPRSRFILTHRGSDRPLSGAVLARDFQSLELPLG
jgi:ribonuclease Z